MRPLSEVVELNGQLLAVRRVAHDLDEGGEIGRGHAADGRDHVPARQTRLTKHVARVRHVPVG